MRKVKLVRLNFGWFRRKHGIWLDPLPASYQRMLLDNVYLREIADDWQALYITLHMFDISHSVQNYKMVVYDPYSNNTIRKHKLRLKYREIEWTCAICGTPIISDMYETKSKNYCCEECRETYAKPYKRVDKRIVESSISFYHYVRSIFEQEHKEYIKNANDNMKELKI